MQSLTRQGRPAAWLAALALAAALWPATPTLAQGTPPSAAGALASDSGLLESEAASAASRSVAWLRDDQGVLDRLDVHVSGLTPAPAGQVYRVWLRSEDGSWLLPAGDLVVAPAAVETADVVSSDTDLTSFTYRQPAGETLLTQYSQVLVTLESTPFEALTGPLAGPRSGEPAQTAVLGPVVLRGALDPGALVQTRRLLARWPDSRYGVASLQGLRLQAEAARYHAAVLREAAVNGDLPTMRRKAEHLVNMVEGQRGAYFGDHNGDGRIEDPGDGVGILTYASGALAQTQVAWAAAQDEQVAEEALAVQRPVQFALEWAGFIRDSGLELARTQDAARAQELATAMFDAAERVLAAIDTQGDADLQGVLDAYTGGTVVPAFDEAGALIQIQLAPPATS